MTRQKKLKDDAHFNMLSLLKQSPEMNHRDLAKALKGAHSQIAELLQERAQVAAYVLTAYGVAENPKFTAGFLRGRIEQREASNAKIGGLHFSLNSKHQS